MFYLEAEVEMCKASVGFPHMPSGRRYCLSAEASNLRGNRLFPYRVGAQIIFVSGLHTCEMNCFTHSGQKDPSPNLGIDKHVSLHFLYVLKKNPGFLFL